MATTAPWASASVFERIYGDTARAVLPALHVAPGQRGRFGTAQAGVREHGHQGHVKLTPFCRLPGRLHAAAAPSRLDGGETDHGQHVGSEGAGLTLGF